MKIERAASIPLIVHDPYFSIWSSADHLYDKNTVHWCKRRQKICGYVTVDDAVYGFMGNPEFHQVIPQQYVDVTATATEYYFENEKIGLKVRFTTPLLLEDLTLVSRPCTYVDFEISKKIECSVSVEFVVSSDLVSQEKEAALLGWNGTEEKKGFSFAAMGRAAQKPLGGCGDSVTIDWGYAYLASRQTGAVVKYDEAEGQLICHLPFEGDKAGLIVAYDDTIAINYFGQWRKSYWTEAYGDIMTAIGAAFADKESVLKRAADFDCDLEKKAEAIGGSDYAFLCSMSYRQVIAAHKLITNENGEVIFLSKENDSNGCIATVDVSYPSVPLFLLYNPELVKGMVRPIMKFAACDVWEYDFAPHDVGRFPYACGQVYGYLVRLKDGEVYPPLYQYPAGMNVYRQKSQMPVEESANILLMSAAACTLDKDASFVRPYMDVLRTWTQYLVRFGGDPEEQLCTDDFAGHLAHNVNLSAKAIMGIEGYARIAEMLGLSEEAKEYHEKAKAMAADWERRAKADDHYTLVFGEPDTWSLKYNLVWDLFFGSKLFHDEVFEKEVAYYVKKTNTYGTPLDNRRDYTKSDWILWCTAMAKDKEQASVLIGAVANYLRNTPSRVPFSDWYETVTGEYRKFIARSVQGGIFMPLLISEKAANNQGE